MDEKPLEILMKNSMINYVVAILIFVIGVFVLLIINKILKKRLEKIRDHKKYDLFEFIYSLFKKTFYPLIFYGLILASVSSLEFPVIVEKTIGYIGVILFTLAGVRFVNALLDYWFSMLAKKKGTTQNQIQGLKGLFSMVKAGIWIIGVIIAAQNMGYNVSAAVAGLGVTGVAVVFAAQAILGDLFSYFSILFDKPFEPGDFIIVGEMMGTVQHVGVKTTRVTSISGEQLVLSNSDLTSSRLKNYKKMQRRRIAFKVGFVYGTSHEELKDIRTIIENIVKELDNVTLDRVHFISFGDFSLNFEIVYYVETPEYIDYMNAQQAINLELKRICDDKGYEFAFPTQTVYGILENSNQSETSMQNR